MTTINGSDVTKVVIACDAGMGSSVMVASTMKKKLKKYDVDVVHTPVNEIPADAQVVLCHAGLADRARRVNPDAVVVPFQSTPSGNCRKASAARLMCSRLASVPWGIAKPSPMYVDTDRSRSRIASAYAGPAAPISTRTAPH